MIEEHASFRQKVLRYPVFDAGGVLLLRAGAVLTERLDDLLRGRRIWLQVYANVVVAHGDGREEEVAIGEGPLHIGRGMDCQLRPVSVLVSKKHCLLRKTAYSVFVTDLESTNGTFLNGARLNGSLELTDGDVLSLGGGAHMRIRIFAALRGIYGSLAEGLVLGEPVVELFEECDTVIGDSNVSSA